MEIEIDLEELLDWLWDTHEPPELEGKESFASNVSSARLRLGNKLVLEFNED